LPPEAAGGIGQPVGVGPAGVGVDDLEPVDSSSSEPDSGSGSGGVGVDDLEADGWSSSETDSGLSSRTVDRAVARSLSMAAVVACCKLMYHSSALPKRTRKVSFIERTLVRLCLRRGDDDLPS
jgi:hypothetical protein